MNIYQIAEKAGVSIATVSRVLNNSNKVSEKTREKVLRVISEGNYRPNVFARGLMIDSMKLVGVICTEVSDIFIAKALSFVQAQLYKRNYDTLLFCIGSRQEATMKHLQYLQDKHVDAIFLIGSAFSDTIEKKELCALAQSVPVIMINGYVEADGIYSVYCDDSAAVEEAVTHFCENNLKNIAFFYDSMTQSTKRKIDGYRHGLEKNGLLFRKEQLIACDTDIESGYNAAKQLILGKAKIDAVIASSDLLAVGAHKAFQEHGITEAVVGCDNTLLCSCTTPPLSSIDTRILEMCETGVQIMDALFQHTAVKRVHVYQPKLILRK